jgi:catechol 2,3-dioxygenase-like lactoylglutathione lyase family enzyme
VIRTHGLTHIALSVRDAERTFRFYHDVFGAVAVYRDSGLIQAQTPGAWDILVFEESESRPRTTGGVKHFGFRLVDPGDIDAAAKEVERAGGKITHRGEFCPGEPYIFFTDPDGYEVEVWYEKPTAADPAV